MIVLIEAYILKSMSKCQCLGGKAFRSHESIPVELWTWLTQDFFLFIFQITKRSPYILLQNFLLPANSSCAKEENTIVLPLAKAVFTHTWFGVVFLVPFWQQASLLGQFIIFVFSIFDQRK